LIRLAQHTFQRQINLKTLMRIWGKNSDPCHGENLDCGVVVVTSCRFQSTLKVKVTLVTAYSTTRLHNSEIRIPQPLESTEFEISLVSWTNISLLHNKVTAASSSLV